MSIILQSGLPHQENAINTINAVFDGVDIIKSKINFQNNLIDISSPILKNNIKKIQQHIHPAMVGNSEIVDYLNIDIKMETGTGKTYVYTQLMYELHKKYGFNKFIILVPTMAIKAGTAQFIKATYVKNHFRDLYDSEMELHVLNPQNKKKGREYFPGSVAEFVKGSKLVSNRIHVLLTNSQMLLSKTMQKEYDQSFEGFSQPLESLRGVCPIVIIDEPHRFDKNNKTFKFLTDNIKPQCIIRFGATFPANKEGKDYHNLVYNLGSCEAFNQNLVKGVSVEYLSDVTGKDTKVKLTTITKNPFVAHFQAERGGIIHTHKLMKGDSLSILDEEFSGVDIVSISKEVELSNGMVLHISDSIYPTVYGATYQDLMLQLGLTRHFEIERANFNRKNRIKTLALFFIDSVHSYRGEDNNGYLKLSFEKILIAKLKDEIKELETLIEKGYDYTEYKEYLQASLGDIGGTNGGYFAQDNETNDEGIQKEVDEILMDKEKLLSIKNEDESYNTRRFIFSKWTLREGWDNPNIFTIAKLRSSGSEISKLQEIGRGLRLPVDENGNRISDEQFYLNYIIDYSEKDFADKLINEINGDTPETAKLRDEVVKKVAESLGYSFDVLKGGLMFKGYIDDDLNIKEEKREELFTEYPLLASGLVKGKILNKNKDESAKIKIRKDKYAELAAFWERINQKYFITYGRFSDEELIDEAHKIFEKGIGKSVTIKSTRAEIVKSQTAVNKREVAGTELVIDDRLPYNTFLKKIYERTNLPINIIHKALVKYSKETEIEESFFNDATLGSFINEFNERKQELLMTRFSYESINVPIHPTALTDEKGIVKEVIVQGRLGTKADNSKVPKTYLYDICTFDSPLERDNILHGEIKEITVFGKIPNKSIRIPTIVNETYSPDFMYIIEKQDGSKQLNLIIETKGADMPSDLRGKERYKIECAKSFFEKLKLEGYNVVFIRQLNGDSVKTIIDKTLDY